MALSERGITQVIVSLKYLTQETDISKYKILQYLKKKTKMFSGVQFVFWIRGRLLGVHRLISNF